MRSWKRAAVVVSGCLIATAARSQEADEPPKALQPFAHLVGAWKGQASPSKDRLRGWIERQQWAWTFEDGRPVGLALTFESGKVLKKATLTHDAEAKRYRLDAIGPDDQPATYEGTFDPKKGLVLDRTAEAGASRERLTLRPNANKIRYVIWVDRKEKGAPTFSRAVDMNLGREGVAFAAGGAAGAAEECVVTGGAASLTVSHEGKAYPLCCSGCREQFLADPARYIEKARLRAERKEKKPAARGPGNDDFDGTTEKKGTP